MPAVTNSAACPAADPKQVKALARNYGKIAKAVTYYNSVCG